MDNMKTTNKNEEAYKMPTLDEILKSQSNVKASPETIALTSRLYAVLDTFTHDKLKALGIESMEILAERTMSPRLYVYYTDVAKIDESYGSIEEMITFLDKLNAIYNDIVYADKEKSYKEKRKVFQTNNDENIILVYYINVIGFSRQQAEHEIAQMIEDYNEDNPKIKQIWLPVSEGNTRVEVIYPGKVVDEVTLGKIQELIDLMKDKG